MLKQSQKNDCIIILEKKIFKKQIKIALLAQKLGTMAKKVLSTQIKLARSYDFRLLAIWKVIKNKKGNIIDPASAIFANDDGIEAIINRLLGFLSCPYKHKALPVRRCFVARKLVGILTIQDRCLQILMRLCEFRLFYHVCTKWAGVCSEKNDGWKHLRGSQQTCF